MAKAKPKPKAPSLLQAAQALPRGKGGFRDLLTKDQQVEFDEFLEWFKHTPKNNRLTYSAARALIEKTLGHPISENALRNHVDAK